MITTKRTNSDDEHFRQLVAALDADLAIRDGKDISFYAQFNKIDTIKHVVVAYAKGEPVGCGAMKEYSSEAMEIKRMYVPAHMRGQGVASFVLRELEIWCKELNYRRCILETGKRQPEAIRMYQKNGYQIIPNYGQYVNVDNSVCFEKDLV